MKQARKKSTVNSSNHRQEMDFRGGSEDSLSIFTGASALRVLEAL